MSKSVEKKGEDKVENKAQEAPKAEASAPAKDETRAEFEAQILKFRGSTQASMAAARWLANKSLEVFGRDGNLQYVYDFLTEIDNTAPNYVRKGAYMAWLVAHAPITYDKVQKKLIKDKSAEAVELDLEGAFKVAFWSFKPDQMTEFFTTIDLIESLKGLVKRHTGSKTLQPANSKAVEAVKRLEDFIETLAA